MSSNKIKLVPINEFLSTDFKGFSLYDCITNIPSIIDGLKVSQRKTMWTVLNNSKTFTVEQLASLVASYTKYHHGATSLESVAVGLAQDFTGSNNMNWLVPDGQFGNILSHESSAARYISTSLHPNWRKWFKKDDELVMDFEIEDGDITEPKFFIPLAPTVLFNGGSGIGTGYSCSMQCYNPADVIANIKMAIKDKPLNAMLPYYKGYKGTVRQEGTQTVYTGVYEKVNTTTLKITQLPIGYDLEKYKSILIDLINAGEIKEFDDHSSESEWCIYVYAHREWIKQPPEMIMDALKLTTRNSNNFVLWNENGRIVRFTDPREIIKYFVDWRLKKFDERRLKLIDNHQKNLQWLNEKKTFIEYFITNSKELVNLGKIDLTNNLIANGFESVDKLLQIRIYNMTKDEIESLRSEICDVMTKVDELQSSTPEKMYLDELGAIKL